MKRRMLLGLALGLAGVLAMAGAARAQADRDGGMQPGPDRPTMAMAAAGGMAPGGPPPAEGHGPAMGPRREGGPDMGPRRDGGPWLPMGGLGPRAWERLRLDLLIQDLFDLVRLEAGATALKLEHLDWAALCRNTTRRFEPRFREAGLTLRWEREPGEAWVQADGRRSPAEVQRPVSSER